MQDIPIHVLAENLCQVLPAVHVLTGCDYTSKIGTKHAALMTNPEQCRINHVADVANVTGLRPQGGLRK